MARPKLLDQVRAVIRLQHQSLATEHAYVQGIKRFIIFHKLKHPQEMGEEETANFRVLVVPSITIENEPSR
jgi:Phage integrase, N-terminal SAM-like domain